MPECGVCWEGVICDGGGRWMQRISLSYPRGMVSTMPTSYLVLSCARYDTRVATITCVCVCEGGCVCVGGGEMCVCVCVCGEGGCVCVCVCGEGGCVCVCVCGKQREDANQVVCYM